MWNKKQSIPFFLFTSITLSACGPSDHGRDAAVSSVAVAAPPSFTCEQGKSAGGEIVDVTGSGHTLYTAPEEKAAPVINAKATEILGETQYHSIDSTTRVQVQCEKDEWVRVQLTEPEWLTNVGGWTKRANLLLPRSPGEARSFTEADIYWDKETSGQKPLIVKAINRIHREDPRCKDQIDPMSVSSSPTKSTPNKIVFFVTCGSGPSAVNVYFSAQDIADSTPFSAPRLIDHTRAVDLCETYAKSNSAHPSTVDFSRIMDMSINDHPNGRTAVSTKFTAKNSFNTELTFNIRCLLDANGLIEATINEAH